MQIMVDGQLQFDGLTSMFTNPILEVGILNVRGLMEFVGLKAVGTALLPLNPRNRRDDDVGIEMFSTPSGPLPLSLRKMLVPRIRKTHLQQKQRSHSRSMQQTSDWLTLLRPI